MATEPVTIEKAWRAIRIISASQVVIAPVAFLVIAWYMDEPSFGPDNAARMTVYTLFALGLVQPLLSIPIRRFQINMMKHSTQGRLTAHDLFRSLTIIRLAFVEAIFIYGFISYVLGTGIETMLWFYPIGAIWAFIYWPRRDKFDAFLKKMETV